MRASYGVSIVTILEQIDWPWYYGIAPLYWNGLIFLVQDGRISVANALGAVSVWRCRLTSIGIPMLKIRRSHDRLIFNMGIPIPEKDGLNIETDSWRYLTLALTNQLHVQLRRKRIIHVHVVSKVLKNIWKQNLFLGLSRPDLYYFYVRSELRLFITCNVNKLFISR